MNKKNHLMSVILTLIFILPITVWANNISIDGNVTLTEQNTTLDYTHIQFDLSWDKSWRLDVVAAPNNWDAAWVFAKWKLNGGTDWSHCTLNTSGHTSPPGSVVENPTSDNPQTGVFIYRSDGNKTTAGNPASLDWDGVKLRWNYGTDGVDDAAIVDVKVFAIEMVYVPQGDFWIGDGNSYGTFRLTVSNSPAHITTEPIVVKCEPTEYDDSQLEGTGILVDGDGGIDEDGDTEISNSNFPTGYKAFYCMKYKISQGQYTDFLNTLTSAQATNRYYSTTSFRYTISGSHPTYSASRPNRACNYLSIMDAMAYADWAGLRLMTELEFEKACRGPANSIGSECAWGINTICPDVSLTISGDENGTETIITDVSLGGCNYRYNTHSGGDGGYGPLRCGIFANSNSNRIESGGTYFGIMEMSGKLRERPVTVGNATGRGYQGTNGNGELTIDGFADISNWPGWVDPKNIGATGSGFRGGSWFDGATHGRVSDRNSAAYTSTARDYYYGFRAVRTP